MQKSIKKLNSAKRKIKVSFWMSVAATLLALRRDVFSEDFFKVPRVGEGHPLYPICVFSSAANLTWLAMVFQLLSWALLAHFTAEYRRRSNGEGNTTGNYIEKTSTNASMLKCPTV